jgi:hypothetical protein
MNNALSTQPIGDVPSASLLDSPVKLQSLQELVCHLLWRNQQLRMEMAARACSTETRTTHELGYTRK